MCRSRDPSRPWRGLRRWLVRATGCGQRVPANVSESIERLAVEHGDGEKQGSPIWGVDPRGAGSEEELLGLRGGQGCRLRGLRWRVFRLSGPERGWGDDYHEDDLRGGDTHGWKAQRRRS